MDANDDPGDTEALSELSDRQARARRDRERQLAEQAPKHVSEPVLQNLVAVTNVLENAAHPAEQKRKVATYICKRVNCPGFNRVCANRAAEYVIFDGLPRHVLESVLDDLDKADARGQVSKYVEGKGGGRGQWFNGVLRLRLAQYSIPERKRRPQA